MDINADLSHCGDSSIFTLSITTPIYLLHKSLSSISISKLSKFLFNLVLL